MEVNSLSKFSFYVNPIYTHAKLMVLAITYTLHTHAECLSYAWLIKHFTI